MGPWGAETDLQQTDSSPTVSANPAKERSLNFSSPLLDISSFNVAIVSQMSSQDWSNAVNFFDNGFDLQIRTYQTIDALFSAATDALDVLILSCQCRPPTALTSRKWGDILSDTWVIIDGQQGFEKWSALPALGNVVAIIAPGVSPEVATARTTAILCERWLQKAHARERAYGLSGVEAPSLSERLHKRQRGLNEGNFTPASLFGLVPNLVKVRREVFGRASEEPYLSILLQMCYAHNAKEHVDLTALGADLRIPLSTLTRKIDYLEDLRLIRRLTNDEDRRRVFVEPTEEAMQKATAYIQAIVSSV